MNLPIDFTESTELLTSDGLGDLGKESCEILNSKGLEIHYGLTPEFADEVAKMALEPAIMEYCPKDCSARFHDRDATKTWLSQGRGTFLLFKRTSGKLELFGYGWVGTGTNPNIPGGKTTFAIRIGEAGKGQGLATHFTRLINYGASAIFGLKDIWLETWSSNAGAVHVYHKVGFEDIKIIPMDRPRPDGSVIPDVRIYMSLPNKLLPTNEISE